MDFQRYFESGWYTKLKDYIESSDFYNIGVQIATDRKTHVIIPVKDSELFLKIFRVVPYDKVKVNILGQDPYSNPIEAFDGLAFSNSTLYSPQPSLSNILEEVENDIYDGFNMDRVTNYSLYGWAEQGVFLNNSAHTVRLNSPDSHSKYWKDFTVKVIEVLNDKDNIVHLLWGRKSQAFKQYITNSTHKIIETSHPSPLSCFNAAPIPFVGSKCFSKCNTYLQESGIEEIVW